MKKLKLFKTGIKGKRQKYRLKKDADQILKYGTKHFLKAKKKNKDQTERPGCPGLAADRWGFEIV